jgi:hypothetical protein
MIFLDVRFRAIFRTLSAHQTRGGVSVKRNQVSGQDSHFPQPHQPFRHKTLGKTREPDRLPGGGMKRRFMESIEAREEY